MALVYFLDPDDKVISKALAFTGMWEERETVFFKKITNKGMHILDIGANIGYFTLQFSKSVGSKGKVTSFEPNPKSFAILEKNVLKNNLKNVVLYKKAVSDFSGNAKFYISKSNAGDNRFEGKLIHDDDDKRQQIEVEVIKLDDFIDNEQVDLMKIDTQGAEMKVFKGASKIIKNNPNLKIITEFWPIGLFAQGTEPLDFLSRIKKLGFKIYDLGYEKMVKLSNEELCKKYPGKMFTNLYCTK